jgi:hypothetical protein
MVPLFHTLPTSFAFFLRNLRKTHFLYFCENFRNYHICSQGNFRDNAKTKIISALLQGQKGVAKGVKRVSRNVPQWCCEICQKGVATCFRRVSRNVSEGCRRMFMYLKKVSSFMTKGDTLGRLWPGRSNMCSTTTSVPAFRKEKQTGMLKGQ